MTIYKALIKGKTYYYGDKLLRIISIIIHAIELGLIIYLLVR